MADIPIMALFLKEDNETTWNDSYTYYGHVSWVGQRNNMKWQLYLLWPHFLRRRAKQPEMTAIPILAMILEDTSETTWNVSYSYYGHVSWVGHQPTWNDSFNYYNHVSWGGQGNHLKWQLFLYGNISWGGQWNYLKMTAIPIMAKFLEEDSETTWNDSYTYLGHVS